MTIQQIRYAVTVAECNSMNKAAEKLFMSQPSLSNAVRELEDELNMEIFIRRDLITFYLDLNDDFTIRCLLCIESFVYSRYRTISKYSTSILYLWHNLTFFQ